jgi:hypothetical protein
VTASCVSVAEVTCPAWSPKRTTSSAAVVANFSPFRVTVWPGSVLSGITRIRTGTGFQRALTATTPPPTTAAASRR